MKAFLFMLALSVSAFAAPPPQAFDLDASATTRRFTLTTAQGTTPLFRAMLRNANTAFVATNWTGTLYLQSTWDDTSVIAIPSTATGTSWLDFQLDANDTATNGVFRANIIATDGTSTVEWQRGEVTINASPGTAGAGTITFSTPLSWSGYQYANTGIGGPYRAGSNVVFTTNGDGSVDINADVAAGSGDVTGITSTDSSITVTSGTGPIPNVALPATLPARNGSLLTALNASALASGTVPTARLGSGTANSSTFLTGAQTYAAPPFATTNAVRAAVADIYLPLAGTEGRSVAWTNDGALFDLGNTEPSYIGTWRGGNGQVAFGVSTNEIPWVWMENDNGFSFLSFRSDDKLWITTDETNTTLVPLRASISATDLLSGTIPDAVFPATLPAISGANLTNLDASDLATGTVSDTVTAAKYRQPVLSWTYRDLTWNTTAAAGWTGYEIESGASGSKRTFGLDAITSAVATDQTGTFKTDWIPVPANFLAFKTTGAIRVTWVSSQAVVGESELRGIRLIGSSDLTGANATDIYTDTTTRDITTTGVPVTVSINRSAFASTTVPAYICVQIDASVEDGDKLAIVSIEVLSE